MSTPRTDLLHRTASVPTLERAARSQRPAAAHAPGTRGRAAIALVWALAPTTVLAQAINITTPQLPPRTSTAVPAAAPTEPGYAGTPTAAPAHAPYGGGGHGGGGYGGGGHGGAPTTFPGRTGGSPAPASPLQQQVGRGSYAPTYPGQVPSTDSGYAGAAEGATPIATPSQPGGTCRAQPSPERHSVSLLGPDGLPRAHLPLGEFRVQYVTHSPDGQWAVAVTKLRGQPQFAATAIDLARCAATHTVALTAVADEVRFDGAVAVLRQASREQRMPLADPRLR